MSPMHEERALPDLRAMLTLPFERVIISHGEPVHTRDAFARALAFIEAGTDVTARDERLGEAAIEWARRNKQDAVVAYLASVTR
jgi:glyoxylase-like metal-dependent hydrolase (beta-lactamase superfamily II)